MIVIFAGNDKNMNSDMRQCEVASDRKNEKNKGSDLHKASNEEATAAKKVPTNFEELARYVHCCPLTYRSFCKYSNVKEIVARYCEKEKLADDRQKSIQLQLYLLFYLVPSDRSRKLVDELQPVENCPQHIKEKFFIIPTKLYLKETDVKKSSANEVKSDEEKISSIKTSVSSSSTPNQKSPTQQKQSVINFPISLEEFRKYINCEDIVYKLFEIKAKNNAELLLKYKGCETAFNETLNNLYQAFYLNPGIREIIPIRLKPMPKFLKCRFLQIPEGVNMQLTSSFSLEQLVYPHLNDSGTFSVPDEVTTEISESNSPNTILIMNKTGDNNSERNSNSPKINDKRTKNDITQTISLKRQKEATAAKKVPTVNFKELASVSNSSTPNQKSPTQQKQSVIKFPISLEEFRKYINCEEIVYKLFEIKAKNNAELLLKYKGCQTAFNETLNNLYQAFYFNPGIREIIPMRLKPMPKILKCRFLQMPEGVNMQLTSSFCLEQLVYPDFNDTGTFSVPENTAEDEVTTEISESNPPNTILIMNKTGDNNSERNSNSPKINNKRTKNEITQTTSSKRQKVKQEVQDAQTSSPKPTKAQQSLNDEQKSYKHLKLYAHCCPVTFTEFRDYTNIAELFRGYCQKRYNNDRKLPHMLHRAYIIYYLAPVNRNYRPFTKLKILDVCPESLRRKIFEIPQSLHLKNEELNEQKPTKNENADESRTSSQCPNINCVYHHISHIDFMDHTNILENLPPYSKLSLIKSICKKFIYNLIKHNVCEDIYNIDSSLISKLWKHQTMCETCENVIHNLLTTNAGSQAIENYCVSDNTNVSITQTGHRESEGINSIPAECTQIAAQIPRNSADLWKSLKTKKTFEKFCTTFLAKLKQTLADTNVFSSDTYKVFLHCNEIPLDSIVRDFCENHDDIAELILKRKELHETLQQLYYYKFLTNEKFASKYPVRLKQKRVLESIEKHSPESNSYIEKNQEANAPKVQEENNNNIVVMKTQENDGLRSTNDTNTLEKAKRIFFRNVDRTNTLSYIIRTTFGLKQLVLRSILTLTYDEFMKITNVYEGNQLYKDNHISACMYRYVFCTANVWPTNLYVTLENLCDFLHAKNIRFNDYAKMLKYISPKLLHWSTLLWCTNILDCVQEDFYQRTGKQLDTNDTITLKRECIEYYNRCWKHDKWLGQVPVVYEELYKDYVQSFDNHQDVTMFDESGLQKICQVSNESLKYLGQNTTIVETNATACANERSTEDIDSNVTTSVAPETSAPLNVSTSAQQSIKEFNCIILPNTQQQIQMLPSETRISNDPLNQSSSMGILNVSSNSCASDEVETLGVLVPINKVKTETSDEKLLSNLVFYEDGSGNIQCTPCSEEIISVDETTIESLPPSQMDFEEAPVALILSDDLSNCDYSNTIMNEQELLPSSSDSNDHTVNKQTQQEQQQIVATTSTQIIQFPDVSLRSSGENESQSNSQMEGQFLQKVVDIEANTAKQLEIFKSLVASYSFSLHSNTTITEAQRFPSTFEDSYAISGSLNGVPGNYTLQPNQLNVIPIENLNVAHIANLSTESANSGIQQEQIVSTPAGNSNVVQLDHSYENPNVISIQQVNQQVMPVHAPASTAVQQYNVLQEPKASNITLRRGTVKVNAKLKAFTNSNYVPQIQHNTRALTTVPAFTANSNDNKEVRSNVTSPEIKSTVQQPVILASSPATESCTNTISKQSAQNTTLQLHMMPSGTQIYISQELNKNCSVFNNTSLLRIVDKCQQLHQQKATEYKQQQEQSASNQPANSKQCQQTAMLSEADTPNDKVNKHPLTHTKNLVVGNPAASTINRTHPPREKRKLCLYRNLITFHYFKELTPQHITKYLLPFMEYGKSYAEATVAGENFKTRISNKSISAIFPFWPLNLQQNLLLVLNDLKEFHYNSFERGSMQKQEDVRERILFWLLETAPSFALCQFIFELNTTEFSYCEPVSNGNNPSYHRKPFKCLTNALSLKVFTKLKDMKRNLK